jgi:hypothetical protein
MDIEGTLALWAAVQSRLQLQSPLPSPLRLPLPLPLALLFKSPLSAP